MAAPSLAPVPLEAPDFASLFEAELEYVWNALRRLGVREADLDDQTNEVFLRVHKELRRFDPARPVRPWLFAFAARVAAEYRRLARNQREIPGLSVEAEDPAPDAEDQMLEREMRSMVLTALDALDGARREVFVALDIEGHTAPQVAEALGVSVNTIYSRLRLARQEFTVAIRRVRAARSE